MLRKITQVLLISLLILSSTSQAGTISAGINVWTSNGPEGGSINARVVDPATPTTLYAGTYGGVFKSTNGGAADLAADITIPVTFTRITSGDIVNDGGQSSGACWGDYDNDGRLDLFVTNWAGQNNFLYHNKGDGTFEKVTTGRIVNDGGWSRACTWGDYDNDGFLDLFVSNDGGGNFLYHNEGGTAFTRVLSGPIVGDDGNCYGAAWVDYDNDGWLDLFVARHTNADNLLYHNKGDGTFDKITTGAIVSDGGYSNPASWGDYDGDGCVDLFVGNVNSQPNFLYHNNCDGSFSKITAGPIVTDVGFSTSSNWVDYDNDGDLDLFVANWYQDNFLYQNDGDGTFTKIVTGVIVTDGNGHDSSWADYDNDGDMDLFEGPLEGLQRLYQNNGDRTFTRITTGPIVADSDASSGVWGDYDNDGDLDLFVARGGDYNNLLYRNDGNENHWIHLKLVGAAPERTRTGVGSNRSAIGARVAVTATINGATIEQIQEVSGQTGFLGQNSLDVEFGLGDAAVIESVTVRWPSGVVQVLTDIAADQFLTIHEPRDVVSQTWHVATNGSDITGDGSEANPFATIQHGIDTASHDDTVLVHPGVYKENINFKGKNITVGSLFVATGDEGYILQTVIDGKRNDHVVTFASGEATTAKLSGFTITNGYAHGTPAPVSSGGGVFCLDSNPTLTHLKVSGNEAVDEGGGLYFAHCSSTVQNVIITNNLTGGGGGGIRYSYGSVSLLNVMVAHNSSRGDGAGMQFYHAEGTVKNALIADNSGGAKGGGLQFDGCSPTFINVTVVGNWTAGHGGALNVSYMSQPTLVNSIVWGNTPEQIYFDTDWPGEAITVEYSDVQGGEAGIVTNGQGPVYWGDGNLDASPRFVNVGLGNYHLADDSPCISAGKAAGVPVTDIEGNPRPNPVGSNPDMGAFENPSSPTVSSERIYFSAGDILYQMNLDGSGLVSITQGLGLIERFAVDLPHNRIYLSRWDQPAQILVFDPSAESIKVFSDGPGYGGQGLAIDPSGNKMYLGLYYQGVYARDVNTASDWIRLVDSASLYPLHGQRGQLQIDSANRHIYFRTAYNYNCDLCRYIWRVNFDGTNLIKIIQANGGDALALDLAEQKMYFSDVPGNYTVKRANLDGTGLETLLTIPTPYRFCRSLVLDVARKKMYLSLYDEDNSYRRRAIARANMDGTGFEILYQTTGNTAEQVSGDMALFLPNSRTPQLEIGQQASPASVLAGSPLTYTLRVTNTGNVDLRATITDTLPVHVTPSGVLTWTPATIASGGVWSQTVVVTVETGYAGVLTNVAQVTTLEGATGSYILTTLALAPHLQVGQQANPDPALTGSQLTYTLHVTNTGNVDLHATITDTLPTHVTPSGILTWTSTITAPGGVWAQQIAVAVDMGYTGPLTNTVQVTTEEGAIGMSSMVVNVTGYSIYLPLVLGGQLESQEE
jgi:uncharacterized repeat protein (TIGR01451 family)